MEQGLIDANLGGGVVKKRLTLPEPWWPQTRTTVGFFVRVREKCARQYHGRGSKRFARKHQTTTWHDLRIA